MRMDQINLYHNYQYIIIKVLIQKNNLKIIFNVLILYGYIMNFI